jgi:hypothetical protein
VRIDAHEVLESRPAAPDVIDAATEGVGSNDPQGAPSETVEGLPTAMLFGSIG